MNPVLSSNHKTEYANHVEVDIKDSLLDKEIGLDEELINTQPPHTTSERQRNLISVIFFKTIFLFVIYVGRPLRDRIIYPLYEKILFYFVFRQYCNNNVDTHSSVNAINDRRVNQVNEPRTPTCHFRSLQEMQKGLLPIDRQLISNFLTPRNGAPYQTEYGVFFDPFVSPSQLISWFGRQSNDGFYRSVACSFKSSKLLGRQENCMMTRITLVKKDEQRALEAENQNKGWFSSFKSIPSLFRGFVQDPEDPEIATSSQEIIKTEKTPISQTGLSRYDQASSSRAAEPSNFYTESQDAVILRLQEILPQMLSEWGFSAFSILRRQDLLDQGFSSEIAGAGDLIVLYHKSESTSIVPKQAEIIELEG